MSGFVVAALATVAGSAVAEGVGRRLVAGMVAGLVAAVAMDWPMSSQPEGFTPAYIAASVLQRRPPDRVTFRDAGIVHHAAGVAAGALYAVVAAVLAAVLPPIVTLGGVDLLAHLVAVALVVGFIYAFFAHLVLPRAGGTVHEERATAVRGQWLRSSLVFGAVLAVVVPAASSLW